MVLQLTSLLYSAEEVFCFSRVTRRHVSLFLAASVSAARVVRIPFSLDNFKLRL